MPRTTIKKTSPSGILFSRKSTQEMKRRMIKKGTGNNQFPNINIYPPTKKEKNEAATTSGRKNVSLINSCFYAFYFFSFFVCISFIPLIFFSRRLLEILPHSSIPQTYRRIISGLPTFCPRIRN